MVASCFRSTPLITTAMRTFALCVWWVCQMLVAQPVSASTLVVPDQSPSIQAAIDSYVDTVLVRPGYYPEVLSILDRVVLRRLAPSGSDELPEVDGFFLDYTLHPPTSDPVIAEGFGFRGLVKLINESTPNDIVFRDCRLDSGITTEGLDTGILQLSRCSVSVGAQLSARIVVVDSSAIQGPLRVHASYGLAQITHNSVVGTGDRGISASGYQCVVTDNQVTGFVRGIALTADHIVITSNEVRQSASDAILGLAYSTMTVEDNVVTDCYGGIVLDGEVMTTKRNRVVRAVTAGISQSSGVRSIIEGNVVLSCGGNGIEFRANSGLKSRIVGNVVGRCGGSGVLVFSGASFEVLENTCYLNGRHGLYFEEADAGLISRNLCYRNQGAGVVIYASVEIGCNDWFENAGGTIVGQPPSDSDVSLDPVFCGLSEDDVSLRVDSPLLSLAACGLIGALGKGCDLTTPTVVTRFTAQATSTGIEVRWQLSHTGGELTAWLERADAIEGPWARVEADRTMDGEVTVELDRGVSAGRRYWYRLVASEAGEVQVLGPPLEVTSAPAALFGLIHVGPNPSRGPVQVQFGLAEAAVIDLDVFDVQGRHLASLARGAWPAGRHSVDWAGRTSGLFLVRYRYPGGSESRRVVRIE